MKENSPKVAIITGAANGIGRAITLELFSKGFNLALIDKDKNGLDNLKESCVKSNVKVLTYDIDITNTDSLKERIDEIRNNFINIDILVNNAGVLKPGLLEIPFKDFNYMLDTHLIASYHLIRMIAPLMQEQKHGYIFNIASQSGKRARPDLGAYAISKYALVGLNEALYEEMMPHNVKVTVICPSVTNTNFKYDEIEKDEKIEPKDIVNTIMYLLNLGDNVCVKEVCLDCKAAFLRKLK
jgi:short-subunit dehydrogenase